MHGDTGKPPEDGGGKREGDHKSRALKYRILQDRATLLAKTENLLGAQDSTFKRNLVGGIVLSMGQPQRGREMEIAGIGAGREASKPAWIITKVTQAIEHWLSSVNYAREAAAQHHGQGDELATLRTQTLDTTQVKQAAVEALHEHTQIVEQVQHELHDTRNLVSDAKNQLETICMQAEKNTEQQEQRSMRETLEQVLQTIQQADRIIQGTSRISQDAGLTDPQQTLDHSPLYSNIEHATQIIQETRDMLKTSLLSIHQNEDVNLFLDLRQILPPMQRALQILENAQEASNLTALSQQLNFWSIMMASLTIDIQQQERNAMALQNDMTTTAFRETKYLQLAAAASKAVEHIIQTTNVLLYANDTVVQIGGDSLLAVEDPRGTADERKGRYLPEAGIDLSVPSDTPLSQPENVLSANTAGMRARDEVREALQATEALRVPFSNIANIFGLLSAGAQRLEMNCERLIADWATLQVNANNFNQVVEMVNLHSDTRNEQLIEKIELPEIDPVRARLTACMHAAEQAEKALNDAIQVLNATNTDLFQISGQVKALQMVLDRTTDEN